MISDTIEQFRAALEGRGIVPPARIVADGKLHRCDAARKGGKGDAAYILHTDGIPAGGYQDWGDGLGWETWRHANGHDLSLPEAAALAERIEAQRAAREAESEKRATAARERAAAIWDKAKPAPADHPYLDSKGVKPSGLRLHAGALAVPVRDAAGELHSLQFIDRAGAKRFLSGGRVAGCMHILGDLETALEIPKLAVAEGYATAATIHAATGLPVAVAFDCGNLRAVALALRARFPNASILICGDNDRGTPGNPGATKAGEAAAAVGGRAILPEFAEGEPRTDWNDFAALHGAEALRAAIERAQEPPKADAPAALQPPDSGPPGEPAPLPERLTMDGRGLWVRELTREGEPKRPRFVCEPFEVLALVRDHVSAGWGLLTEIRDPDRRAHRIIIPHATLKGEGAEALGLLMDRGMVPRYGTDRYLVEYLREERPAKRARVTDRTGWHPGGAYVLQDRTIGDGDEPTIFRAESAAANTFKARGTLEQWREHVAALCIGNSRLLFSVSAAFAAALIGPAGAESGGIHWRGSSSTGKTTLLRVAASCCGGPEYVGTWRGTDNGVEGVAQAHCDALLILDEIEQHDSRVVGATAYMLANQRGKARANRSGGLRERANWRTLFMSSGEIGLAELIALAGGKARAGQELRIAEIPVDADKGCGAFEELHGHTDGNQFARALADAVRRYHGTAFPEFVARAAAELAALPEHVREFVKRFERATLTSQAEGQARRVAARFALIAAGGELATAWGITGWPEGAALGAAEACFRAWVARRGGESNTEERAALRQVREFLRRYGESAFSDWDRPATDTDTRASVRSDRVGYRRPGTAGLEFFIFADPWRARVCAGLDSAYVGRAMAGRGFAESGTEKDRPHLVRVTLPEPEGRARVVHVLPSIWDTEE